MVLMIHPKNSFVIHQQPDNNLELDQYSFLRGSDDGDKSFNAGIFLVPKVDYTLKVFSLYIAVGELSGKNEDLISMICALSSFKVIFFTRVKNLHRSLFGFNTIPFQVVRQQIIFSLKYLCFETHFGFIRRTNILLRTDILRRTYI